MATRWNSAAAPMSAARARSALFKIRRGRDRGRHPPHRSRLRRRRRGLRRGAPRRASRPRSTSLREARRKRTGRLPPPERSRIPTPASKVEEGDIEQLAAHRDALREAAADAEKTLRKLQGAASAKQADALDGRRSSMRPPATRPVSSPSFEGDGGLLQELLNTLKKRQFAGIAVVTVTEADKAHLSGPSPCLPRPNRNPPGRQDPPAARPPHRRQGRRQARHGPRRGKRPRRRRGLARQGARAPGLTHTAPPAWERWYLFQRREATAQGIENRKPVRLFMRIKSLSGYSSPSGYSSAVRLSAFRTRRVHGHSSRGLSEARATPPDSPPKNPIPAGIAARAEPENAPPGAVYPGRRPPPQYSEMIRNGSPYPPTSGRESCRCRSRFR